MSCCVHVCARVLTRRLALLQHNTEESLVSAVYARQTRLERSHMHTRAVGHHRRQSLRRDALPEAAPRRRERVHGRGHPYVPFPLSLPPSAFRPHARRFNLSWQLTALRCSRPGRDRGVLRAAPLRGAREAPVRAPPDWCPAGRGAPDPGRDRAGADQQGSLCRADVARGGVQEPVLQGGAFGVFVWRAVECADRVLTTAFAGDRAIIGCSRRCANSWTR